MIGVIRGRLSSQPSASVWSDAHFQRLFDPNVPFSLGNFWRTASFGLADLTYTLFPPVMVDDPRPTLSSQQLAADHEGRNARTRAFVQAVEDQFHPDWNRFSTIFIWCASPLDLWGTSLMDHGHGRSAVMTCDVASRFDQICHELGHTLGFAHPLGRQGEYDSPYDIMGGYDSSWTRGPDPSFPSGTPDRSGVDPLRLIGPLLSAAQLTKSTSAKQLAPLFTTIPDPRSPVDVVLHALDTASAAWPQPVGPVAVSIPADPVSPDRHYILELRRARGYDAGIGSPGVVVHGYNSATKQFFYAGVLPLTSDVGDTDLHLFMSAAGTDVTLRLLEVGPDDTWAKVRIGGPNYWRNFGVDIDVRQLDGDTTYSLPQTVRVRPCVFAEFGEYSFRYVASPRSFEVAARSFGYESPHYSWTVEGQDVTPAASGSIVFDAATSAPQAGEWQRQRRSIKMPYSLTGSRLVLGPPTGDPVEIGNFNVHIEVRVDESSREVLANNYPTRSVTTSLRWDAVAVDWDARYEAGIQRCEDVVREVDRRRIPIPPVGPDLGRMRPDDDLPNLLDVLDSLIDRNPAAANALIEHVVSTSHLSTLDVIARLQQRRHG